MNELLTSEGGSPEDGEHVWVESPLVQGSRCWPDGWLGCSVGEVLVSRSQTIRVRVLTCIFGEDAKILYHCSGLWLCRVPCDPPCIWETS